MKLKEIIIYVATIVTNILLGFLLNTIFFDDTENFIFMACGCALLCVIIDSLIAQKLNYKLDIFAYDITDLKYLILNSIFIGCLFSVPIAMFTSLLL